jgi:hypothetical protein
MANTASRRASQWASHFEIGNVNKDLAPGEAYTYDLEWSPDAIKPPIRQRVRGVPPAYIECACMPLLALFTLGLALLPYRTRKHLLCTCCPSHCVYENAPARAACCYCIKNGCCGGLLGTYWEPVSSSCPAGRRCMSAPPPAQSCRACSCSHERQWRKGPALLQVYPVKSYCPSANLTSCWSLACCMWAPSSSPAAAKCMGIF